MANQRKQGIERITLTLPDEMLSRLELEAEARGMDRLAIMREAIAAHLTQTPTKARSAAKAAKAKPRAAGK